MILIRACKAYGSSLGSVASVKPNNFIIYSFVKDTYAASDKKEA